MKARPSAAWRLLATVGLSAGLLLAGLVLWIILCPSSLLDLIQALDFALV